MPSSENPEQSADLLRRIRLGDDDAATAVFERYVERLTRLARSRLAARIAVRVDAEDIVMSAYRSFFLGARSGRFEVMRGGDLWRLLVEMTLHKLYRQIEHHQAQRRSVAREQTASPIDLGPSLPVSHEPTPEEAATIADELEAILRSLVPRDRQALELRLQGFEHEEIAQRLDCSERTVRRAMNEARRIMVTRAGGDFVPSAARSRHRSQSSFAVNTAPRDLPSIPNPLPWTDFILHEQIGYGATGKVYRALHKSRQREVAIKFLKKALAREPPVIERFLREAHTVASLGHSGIVAMHGAGQTPGGGLFLVMDLVDGCNLEQQVRSEPIDALQIATWVETTARTIHFAHERGVIHCDLKPSNLLLDKRGCLQVTDFGFAVRADASEAILLAGTPAFMAPEQADPCWGSISPQTDVWGLGGILLFLLTGHPPHTGPDIAEVLSRVVSARPVLFSDLEKSRTPPPLAEIALRCLAKPPGERFATALEVANALAAYSAVVR